LLRQAKRSRTARRQERVFEETSKVGFTRRRKRLFFKLFSLRDARFRRSRLSRKSQSPKLTQRNKRRGLKVSNAFFDGPPDLPDGRKGVE
jgi:hypothetical protein